MKKLISLLLVVCMLAACCTAFAAEKTTEQKADALNLIGLFNGTDKGYELDADLTREQGLAMVIRVLGQSKEANSGKYVSTFADVKDWAKGYVGYGFEKGITKGISETAFGYGLKLDDAMFLTMLLRALGYSEGTESDKDFVWNDPYKLAFEVKLITAPSADAAFSRGDMVEIIYSFLHATYKGSQVSVVSDLVKNGVMTQAAYDAAQKVAAGTLTLEEAKNVLNGGGSPSDPGTTPGGSEGGGASAPTNPDPAPGMGGSQIPESGAQQEDHETPDIDM